MDFHPLVNYIESVIRAEKGVPGCDIKIMRHHETLFRYQSGYCDYEATMPVSGTELYFMYSCTKPVTGNIVLVAQFTEIVTEAPTGTIKISSKSLITSGVLQIKLLTQYLDFEAINAGALDNTVLENGGVLVWYEDTVPANLDEAVIGNEDANLTYVDGGIYQGTQEYAAYLEVNSWEYARTPYFRPYVVIDGQYVYGDLTAYGVLDYCDRQLTRSTTAAKLKSLLVSLLNYGAAAQVQFGQYTDDLANADLQKYVDGGYVNASDLELGWDDAYLTDLVAPDAAMTANFAPTGTLTNTSKTLFLAGAISVKLYMNVGKDKTAFENPQDATFYYWTAEDYAKLQKAGQALTKENASYTTEPTSFEKYSDGTWEYITYSDGIYAMDYSDTLYAAMCVTDANGVEHCSGVVNYSPEYYAARQLAKSNIAANLKNVIQWMVVYGERAAAYFG